MNTERTVESITETKEEVSQALGLNPESSKEVKEETESVSADEAEENAEESETPETEANESEKPQKKKGGFQKKIDKLTKEKYDLQAEIESLKSSRKETEEKKETTPESKEPNIDDFDNYKDYIKAAAKWEAKELLKAEKAAESEAKAKIDAQTAFQQKAEGLSTKLKDLEKTKADYKEVLSGVEDLILSNALIDQAADSEHGAEILYLMAKDPEELEKINSLTPNQIAKYIGKYEALVENSLEKKPVKQHTKLPSPIKPLGQSSKASVEKSPYTHDMTYEEFKAWEAKQK